MIGEEGSYSQLQKYTVNKPPPTSAQIKTNLQPITVPFNKFIDGIKNGFKNLGLEVTKVFWIIIVLFVIYIITSANKK